LPNLAPASPVRSSLAELVVMPDDYPPASPIVGYLQVAQRIQAGAALWSAPRGALAEWRRQHYLIRAEAALRTVAREDWSLDDRWWHLEVAALALRSLLGGDGSSVSLPTPPSGPRPQPPPPTPTTASTRPQTAHSPIAHPGYSGRTKFEF